MNILTRIVASVLLIQVALYAQERRPNVLFITSDDLGIQLSCYGDEVIETPNLDALASSGVLLRWRTSPKPHAAPREAMLTGLYPHSNGQYGLTATTTSLHAYLHDATLPNTQACRLSNGDHRQAPRRST